MRNLKEENIVTYFDDHQWIKINRQKTSDYYIAIQERNTANERQFAVIQRNRVGLHNWENCKDRWNNEPVQLPSHYLFSFHLDAINQRLNCQKEGVFIREYPLIRQI